MYPPCEENMMWNTHHRSSSSHMSFVVANL